MPKRNIDDEYKSLPTPKKKSRIEDPELPLMVEPPVDDDGIPMMRVGSKQWIKMFKPTERLLTDHCGGRRVAIVGASGSGKSVLMQNFLAELASLIPAWSLVNPSEDGNANYGRFCSSPAMIHTEFKISWIKSIIDRQTDVCARWRSDPEDPKSPYLCDPNIGILIDDVTQFKDTIKSDEFRWLFMVSRNFKCLVFYILQYYVEIPKSIRECGLSHIVLFPQDNKKNIKELYDNFAGFCENINEFKSILNKVTAKKGSAIVIDRMSTSTNISDRIFYYYKPENTVPFKLGSKSFQNKMKAIYDSEWKTRGKESTNKNSLKLFRMPEQE